ncbi:MAG: hypothetical protein ACRCSF_08265 [Mycobacteriaceae bacterium]
MVRVDPEAVLTAGQAVALTGMAMELQVEELVSVLNAQGGMAGTDTAAIAFASQYDPAAKDIYASILNWCKGVTNLGLMLGATAQNHNDANAAAAGQSPPDIGSMPGVGPPSALPHPATLPSTLGDPAPGPWWWGIIQSYVQGKLWPNGHQDRLKSTAEAWKAFAHSLDVNAWQLYKQLEILRQQDSPDIDAAIILCGQAYSTLFDINNAIYALAEVCSGHAHNIDDAHSAIEASAAEIVAESAIIYGIGLLFTVPSGGASDALSASLGVQI